MTRRYLPETHSGVKYIIPLLRPGRIDRREHIGTIGSEEARAMCRAFLGAGGDAFFETRIAGRLPMAPAALQGELLAYEPPLVVGVAA